MNFLIQNLNKKIFLRNLKILSFIFFFVLMTMSVGRSGYNTDDIREPSSSTIQANILTPDLKHVYYVMGGYLYCYSLSRDNETANCRNRRADVTDPLLVTIDNHGPILSQILVSPISLSWLSSNSLNISSGRKIIVYDLPQPTETTKNLTWGINGHPGINNAFYNDIDEQFKILSKRHLTSYRVGFVPNKQNGEILKSLAIKAKGYGIELSVLIDLSWLLCSDSFKFDSLDPDVNKKKAYDAVTEFILAAYVEDDKSQPLIKDWELGNEIDLKLGDKLAPSTWDSGWNSADWRGVKGPGKNGVDNKDYFKNWAQGILGAANAIKDINTSKKVNLRKLVNTTSTHFGFLKYLQEEGVDFDVITYHSYLRRNDSPYNLGGLSFTKARWFNTFAHLAKFNLPIQLNEINCAEIYDVDYKNDVKDPKLKTCFQTFQIQLNYWLQNTQINLEKIFAYELLDEPDPSLPSSERKFGLMWNITTPKPMLSLLTLFAGGELSQSDKDTLSEYSSLIPLRSAQTFYANKNFYMESGSTPIKTSFGNVSFQQDGNLVMRDLSEMVIWESRTYSGNFGSGRAIFQDDGNFVIYQKTATGVNPIWSTKTYSNQGQEADTLTFVNRLPNMRMTDSQKNLVWVNRPEFSPGELVLKNGQFAKFNLLTIPHTLVLEDDGNLVLYKNIAGSSSVVWKTTLVVPTCSGQCVLNFQTDGNLVLARAGVAYWSSRTSIGHGKKADKLIISGSAPFVSIVDTGYNILFHSAP